jgi:hypothetical protein
VIVGGMTLSSLMAACGFSNGFMIAPLVAAKRAQRRESPSQHLSAR